MGTDPWVSRKHEHTGMAFLEITVNEESWEVYQITLSPLVKESFKRYPCYDSSLKQELKSGGNPMPCKCQRFYVLFGVQAGVRPE